MLLIFTENRCPLTLEGQSAVRESTIVSFRCSTLASCSLMPMLSSVPQKETVNGADANFNASWEDDGMEISCQVQGNKDPYLIRKMTLRVECELSMCPFQSVVLIVNLGDGDCVKNFFNFLSFYWTDEPKNIFAEVTPSPVQEGQRVTFSCSARGQPKPTFTWFKNGQQVSQPAQWNIASVADSQNGTYYCEAHNSHGKLSSSLINLIVQCKSIKYFTVWNPL